ncbi:efflux RND transporter permease subunit [Labrys wisconsinensis]|uniref:HAE1 family hydrophobic/amphiphilic exporter-1 n=1 Tax=Labrys wisconsinensis TaxID=425677 RepID=A0ABU0JCK6_9HYPH|nr:efflux RND transporter permease subunit [Labrys wisconsinensis]MDQ0472008.1 HAE1 family hydrophobic/amphiphilic exporter-1 [Labrys wisconsinensis]
MNETTEDSRRSGLSAWFIRRPVASVLAAAALSLLGVAAFPNLSVAPLPEIDFPTIQVTALLPGASPETMASAVATPLETAFAVIPGITEMTSTSALGQSQVAIQFTLERDIDAAAQEVQAAINSVSGRLPGDMPNLPTWRKVNPTDSPVMVLSVTSDAMPITTLSDLIETRLARRLGQIDGVAQIFIAGQQKPAVRIRYEPDRLAGYGLATADLRAAVQGANVNQAKGAVFGRDSVATLQTNDQLFTPQDYENVVVSWRNGAPVKVGDVARVVIGAEDAYAAAFPRGEMGLGVIILRQPGANIVRIADAIQAALPALTAELPPDVSVRVMNDRTRTIRASLHEVELTLIVTLVLVVAVMGIFLRQVAATAIVAVVLGVAVVATFAAMYLAGFTLNNLTLVALIIAIGFIVDDAIVVVENIHRHMEAGAGAVEAALQGAREIGFTVVSITLSLIAAFIPLLFMGGIIGRLFREFSLTVTMALLISLVVALTLAPALCARFMPPTAQAHAAGRRGMVDRLIDAYAAGLRWTLRHRRIGLLAFFLTVGATGVGYALIPKGFFPLQDTAFVIGTTIASEDVSYEAMREKHLALAEIVRRDPAVLDFNLAIGRTGGSQSLANGRLWVVLKDRGDRDVSAEGFIGRIRPQLAVVPGLTVQLRSAQDINLGVGGGAAQYSYVVSSADQAALALWTERLTRAMAASPLLRDVRHDMQLGARTQSITIDRAAAARLGVSVADIDGALYDAFGQRQIGEFQTQVNQYRIVLEADPARYARIASLDTLFLRGPGGMVPLSAVARVEPQTAGPLIITRSGQAPAATISFNLPVGVALGDAVTAIETLKASIGLPAGVTGRTQGTAQAFQASLASQPWLVLAALIAVYLILGVLYESYSTPLTILSTLPSAGLGALGLLWLWRLDFSVMALIGVILLIGIVKKNGILMVDFALAAQRSRGLGAEEAIYEAALARFRPILMTTIAALLAAVPLMLSFGTGAELRQPLGVAVVGGLVVSQVLTLFTTPVVYVALDRLFGRRAPPAAVPAAPRAVKAEAA